MSTVELFALVLLASGLSAFTGALGSAFAHWIRGSFLRRQIKQAIARNTSGPSVLK